MRKISYILTAILTFSISAVIYFCYLNFSVNRSSVLVAPVESSSLPLISLCGVLNNPELYRNNNFRMKGDLSVALNSNSFFIKNSERDCGSISISPVFWNDKDEYFGGFEMTAEAAELLKHRDKKC